MNFSARQGARKWPGLGKMITAVAALGLVAALPSPGQARGRSFGLEELFGGPPRSHRAVHAAKVPVQAWLEDDGSLSVEDLCHTDGSSYSLAPVSTDR